ncbi:flagellar hook-associated protein FlgK [Novosphingobium colocasiae]|uniref:flagellar hook-associated protein FlgK n=1 Tax=Novosphingobium colocasiae TaxID=1256513 RepID=UPI0035AECC03
MGSDLLSIARTGARAARAALDVTAQNITNAGSEGYVRRSVRLAEVASGSIAAVPADINLSGVAVAGVTRNADLFRQSEVRRTGADAARAGAEVDGLTNIESAVEQTGVYDGIVKFEAALQQLLSDPTDGALRAAVTESGRTMAQTFNVAAGSLDAVGTGLRFEANDGVTGVNRVAGELARVNLRLARAIDQSSDQTSLLDQRDALLQQLSEQTDLTTAIATDNTVTVAIGGTPGATLVNGGTASPLAATTAADGTLAFTLGGTPVAPASGALAGKNQALAQLSRTRHDLDAVAADLVATVNAAQATGVDLAGKPGQPLFAGSNAAGMAMIATGGSAVATATSGTNSRDPANLKALRSALADHDPAGRTDTILFAISSAVAGRAVTRDALTSIADNARIALQAQAGVDLDQEAINLTRYQQAFQASGRVIQVASDIFDTLLGIR